MSNLIQIDFRKQEKVDDREVDAFKAFEEAMMAHEKRQKTKLIFWITGLALCVLGLMAMPFAFQAAFINSP